MKFESMSRRSIHKQYTGDKYQLILECYAL